MKEICTDQSVPNHYDVATVIATQPDVTIASYVGSHGRAEFSNLIEVKFNGGLNPYENAK
jgi:hypothetical protein